VTQAPAEKLCPNFPRRAYSLLKAWK